ncbi:DoxX family protein [Jiangella anatolica]|uniref:DoxX family protein n=1 Tax=Jiangella anatolica TaxID=2670374 RepID=A0A2W2B0U0_9ACTN|nr:DoxX family protein [Jiangella anatolica]PZF81061.1 DoxX family protein [Jiangella anatolica]
MDVVFLIGRILFVAVFLGSSAAHLSDRGAMAGYAESRGVRPGQPAVWITGAQILIGGLSVLLGVWMDVGAILLALFTLSTALLMHRFWPEKDPTTRQQEMIQFMKDIALAGASLILLFLVWELGDATPLTLTDPLFDVD